MRRSHCICKLSCPTPRSLLGAQRRARQVTQVQCEEVCIADAEMIIMRSKDAEKFRLVILSRNRCTVLSQVCTFSLFAAGLGIEVASLMTATCPKVSDSFFNGDSAGGSTGKGAAEKFASPTWLVQMESPGVRKVYHYAKGFRFLSFQSAHGEFLRCWCWTRRQRF